MPIVRNEAGLLTRLARDGRGNTLAIAAAMLIPLIGLTGSAVDTARLYVVKVRLQQACDAGVLAGRKFMTDTQTDTPLDDEAATHARTFFDNNFKEGWFQTTNVDFTPTKTRDGNSAVANAVSGSATATVPMSVMHFFGVGDRALNVECRAHFDLADTDVMFVLDTTGSMACKPSASATCGGTTKTYIRKSNGALGLYAEEVSGSKLQGLRDAVILFEETMRENKDDSTHVRYGFVTYSSSTNVGGVLNGASFLEKAQATYQTRWVDRDYNQTGGGSAGTTAVTGVTQAECQAKRSPAGALKYKMIDGAYRAYSWSGTPTWSAGNGGTCTGSWQKVRPYWRYGGRDIDVSAYVASYTPNEPAAMNPSRLDGLASTWQGCIEEQATRADADFTDLDNLPADLNPDTKTGKWRPAWPDVTWMRAGSASVDVQDGTISEDNTGNNTPWTNKSFRPNGRQSQLARFACGMPARTLAEMTADDIDDYVNHDDFRAFGGTYHDVGMIWGARLLSPNGIFGSTTAAWPGRNEPSRNIIFMTDGVMSTYADTYGLWGTEQTERRVSAGASDDKQRHINRFRAVCNYAKTRLGITIHVVAFGNSAELNSDLIACASPGQTHQAANTDELEDAFSDIAERIAMLRLTR